MARVWLCSRCAVTATRMDGFERVGPPLNWVEEGDEAYCLGCRRERAGDAAIAEDDGASTAEERQRMRRAATIAFEIERDPTRANSAIARACRTSAPVVMKARRQLG